MENTLFIKKYINLFKYDKPIRSLPFILLIFLVFLVLSNVCMTILIENDAEKTLASIIVIVEDLLMFSCIIEHSLNPEKTLRLIELIEDDFLVDQGDYIIGGEWERFELFFDEKRKDMRSTTKYLSVAVSLLCLGVINKNLMNKLLGMTPGSQVEEGWLTPFPAHMPSDDFDSSAFFVYIYASQSIMAILFCMEGFLIQNSVCLATDRIVADFETIYMLLDDLARDFSNTNSHSEEICGVHVVKLRKDTRRIVKCHQSILRNFKICASNSAFAMSAVILVILNDSCYNAYSMLKSNDVKKTVYYAVLFTLLNLTVFFTYHNGQRIFNQNVILRHSLAKLPWTDKPRWFKQIVHIMMTRANVDIEMKPYGIYVLNYMSFKDLMKFAFSVGNVLYSTKGTRLPQTVT